MICCPQDYCVGYLGRVELLSLTLPYAGHLPAALSIFPLLEPWSSGGLDPFFHTGPDTSHHSRLTTVR